MIDTKGTTDLWKDIYEFANRHNMRIGNMNCCCAWETEPKNRGLAKQRNKI